MKDQSDGTKDIPSFPDIGLENYAPYLMNRIMGRYNESLREEMAALELTPVQMRALAILTQIDGPLIRDLAVFAIVEQSTLSRALDGLEADGLIRRATAKEDNRARLVHITEKGREVFDALWPRMFSAYEQMFTGVPDTDREAFVRTLQSILRNTRRHPI